VKRVLKSRVRRRVNLTLKSGAAFQGVLYEFDSEAFVLRDTVALGQGGPTPVDGELLALTADVAYVQFL